MYPEFLKVGILISRIPYSSWRKSVHFKKVKIYLLTMTIIDIIFVQVYFISLDNSFKWTYSSLFLKMLVHVSFYL